MKTTWASIVVCVLSSSCIGSVGTGLPDAGEPPDSAARDAGGSAPDSAEPDAVQPDVGAQGRDAAEADTGIAVGSSEAGTCGWTSYDEGLSGAAIVDVLFDARAAPGTVYATTANTIYQSTDSGFTWHLQGSSSLGDIGFLAAPGTDPNVFIASSGAGVLESRDAGKTWDVLSFGGVATQYVAVAAGQPLRVYASVPGAGLFRSDDAGQTFAAINEGIPYSDAIAIDVAPDDADDAVAVLMLEDEQNAWSGSTVVRTTSGGTTWSTVLSGAGYAWNVRRCASNPAIVYVATATGIARSVDRGRRRSP